MKKRYYKAVATVTDGVQVWDVVIYSHYEVQPAFLPVALLSLTSCIIF